MRNTEDKFYVIVDLQKGGNLQGDWLIDPGVSEYATLK
jgi:hypothetical protein